VDALGVAGTADVARVRGDQTVMLGRGENGAQQAVGVSPERRSLRAQFGMPGTDA
jgi:hypothetical protein